MIWLYVLFGFFVLIFTYLLFAPISLEINTEENIYRFKFHRLFSITITEFNIPFFLELKIFGFKKRIKLEGASNKNPFKESRSESKRGNRKTEGPLQLKKIVAVLGSFKLRKCDVSLDFGDVQWNGILYPLFYFFEWYLGKRIQINFIGNNRVILQIENNIARMVRAYLRSK